MYSKILYAIDINRPTDKNFDKALKLANIHSATLEVIYVMKPVYRQYSHVAPMVDRAFEKNLIDQSEKVLKDLLVNHPEIPHELLTGDPTNTIIDYAEKNSFDLILLNGHTHNVFGRLSAIADRVINHSKKDVLLLK